MVLLTVGKRSILVLRNAVFWFFQQYVTQYFGSLKRSVLPLLTVKKAVSSGKTNKNRVLQILIKQKIVVPSLTLVPAL